MIDFSNLKSLTIPEGEVKKIECNGVVLWEAVSYTNLFDIKNAILNKRRNSSGLLTDASGMVTFQFNVPDGVYIPLNAHSDNFIMVNREVYTAQTALHYAKEVDAPQGMSPYYIQDNANYYNIAGGRTRIECISTYAILTAKTIFVSLRLSNSSLTESDVAGLIVTFNEEITSDRLLNLDRAYVNGIGGGQIAQHLDDSKAYLNARYDSYGEFNATKSATVSGVTENSVTVTESGYGGIGASYPVHLPDLSTQAYRITFDYSGAGKCRAYYRYATDTGIISGVNIILINDTAGASGSVDFTIPVADYTWIIVFFVSNTGNTKTYSNVSLTKA